MLGSLLIKLTISTVPVRSAIHSLKDENWMNLRDFVIANA
jgi:hypothetical protein